MDTEHCQEDIIEVAKAFCVKMENSGYNKLARWEVLRSATVKYFRELAEWKTGGKPMYRTREEMAQRSYVVEVKERRQGNKEPEGCTLQLQEEPQNKGNSNHRQTRG